MTLTPGMIQLMMLAQGMTQPAAWLTGTPAAWKARVKGTAGSVIYPAVEWTVVIQLPQTASLAALSVQDREFPTAEKNLAASSLRRQQMAHQAEVGPHLALTVKQKQNVTYVMLHHTLVRAV